MVYVGIVGALTSRGQNLVQIIKKSTGVCKLLFTVDSGYQANDIGKGEYRTVDEAVAVQFCPSFVVIDVMEEGYKERAKLYRFYGITAIVGGGELSEQEMDTLEKGYNVLHRTFAPVLIEPSLITEAAQTAFNAIRKILKWVYTQPVKFEKQVYYNLLSKINLSGATS